MMRMYLLLVNQTRVLALILTFYGVEDKKHVVRFWLYDKILSQDIFSQNGGIECPRRSRKIPY